MEIGLALAGGGVRGAAHIGAIKALEENDIKISHIAGTSAGSIVSALYAMGYSTKEMIKLFEYFAKEIMEINPRYIFSSIRKQKSVKLRGLASSFSIENGIKQTAKLKDIKNISDIKMPIAIPATDLLKNRKIVFTNQNLKGDYYINDIEVGKAVRASANFPGMYEPFEYGEYQFVDGGIFDNLPVAELKKMNSNKVLAIKFDVDNPKRQNTMYNISMKSLDLMQDNLMQDSIKLSDFCLSIDLRDVKVFNYNKVDFCYEEGYKQTLEQIDKIKEKLIT